jgi:uncharacterized metal-binding protein YceD (DUF177 family)
MERPGELKIPYRELSVGDHRFEFVVGESFFEGFDHSLVNGGEARIAVDVHRNVSGMTLVFSIEGHARVECDRCLEPLTLPVNWQGELPVKVDAARAGEYDGEAIFAAPGEESVDLSQWVYESICLSLPMTRVHGEDENGVSLCDPDMLSRFKIASEEDDGIDL